MTDIRTDGLIRESLYSSDGVLRTSGLVRETLRSTGTGIGTYIAVDALVHEVLMVPAPPITDVQRVMILA